MKKYYLFFSIIVTFFAVTIAVAALFMASEFGSITEIKRWKSPDEEYALAVIVRRAYIDLFARHEQYMIIIGRNGAVPNYGHPKEYSFINGFLDYDAYISRCSVVWGADGATFQEPEGHKLFFPKKVYVGGR